MFEFDTIKYVAAHGKAPKGYGFWVFWTPYGCREVVASGSLKEAKKTAIQKLKAQGLTSGRIIIMP